MTEPKTVNFISRAQKMCFTFMLFRSYRHFQSWCKAHEHAPKNRLAEKLDGRHFISSSTWVDEPDTKFITFNIAICRRKNYVDTMTHECMHAADAACEYLRKRKYAPKNCPDTEIRAYTMGTLVSVGLRWRDDGFPEGRKVLRNYFPLFKGMEFALDPANWRKKP